MFNIGPWFAGYLLILIHLSENFKCNVNMEQLYADCSKLQLVTMPTDLDKQIQIMNISFNRFDNLTEKDFAPFANLKELIMIDLYPSHVAANLFDPLQQLIILDISGTYIGNPPAKLPTSIKRLLADRLDTSMDTSVFNMTSLQNLEILSMRSGKLANFPQISTTAPLIYLDLTSNPLFSLTYSNIAPYCLLQTLGLEDVNVPSDSCCGILNWAEKYKISTNLKCAVSCGKAEEFSVEAVESYKQCFGLMDPSLLVQLAVIVIIILCLVFAVFKYLKKSRTGDITSNDKKLEDVEEEAEKESSTMII